MSEAEVVDPAAGIDKEAAACFGEWEDVPDCTGKCEISDRCKKQTKMAPKPAGPPQALEPIHELPEMDPKDYLIQSMKGKYDTEEVMNGATEVIRCRRDGKLLAKVQIKETGRYHYLISTKKGKLQLSKLESVKQAHEIFKALLSV